MEAATPEYHTSPTSITILVVAYPIPGVMVLSYSIENDSPRRASAVVFRLAVSSAVFSNVDSLESVSTNFIQVVPSIMAQSASPPLSHSSRSFLSVISNDSK